MALREKRNIEKGGKFYISSNKMKQHHWQNTDCGDLNTKLPESQAKLPRSVTYSKKKNSTSFINFTRIKQTSVFEHE